MFSETAQLQVVWETKSKGILRTAQQSHLLSKFKEQKH